VKEINDFFNENELLAACGQLALAGEKK